MYFYKIIIQQIGSDIFPSLSDKIHILFQPNLFEATRALTIQYFLIPSSLNRPAAAPSHAGWRLSMALAMVRRLIPKDQTGFLFSMAFISQEVCLMLRKQIVIYHTNSRKNTLLSGVTIYTNWL